MKTEPLRSSISLRTVKVCMCAFFFPGSFPVLTCSEVMVCVMMIWYVGQGVVVYLRIEQKDCGVGDFANSV